MSHVLNCYLVGRQEVSKQVSNSLMHVTFTHVYNTTKYFVSPNWQCWDTEGNSEHWLKMGNVSNCPHPSLMHQLTP